MLNQFVASLRARVRLSIQAIIREAALLGAASVFGVIVIVFLVIAAYDALELVVAPHYAALIVAAAFSVLVLVCVLSSGVLSSSPADKIKAQAVPEPPAPVMKSQMEQIASSLARGGFRREGVMLQAAAEASKNLKPIHILALSLLGGFVLGRRFERR